jgi:hypothetical protein
MKRANEAEAGAIFASFPRVLGGNAAAMIQGRSRPWFARKKHRKAAWRQGFPAFLQLQIIRN